MEFAHLANWFTLFTTLVNESRARGASPSALGNWAADPDMAAQLIAKRQDKFLRVSEH